MDLLGKTLGNYRIDSLLGAGGMGTVYHAHDLILQREVAIKLIHPHLAQQPGFRERFIKEARIMAQLDHPGIVRVHHMGVEKDLLYLPMEFIKGGNLRQLLDELAQQQKSIPLQEAVHLVKQLCETVEYAHQHGVLHRDIKPANLMLKPEPSGKFPFRVILTDLGLAKLLENLGMTQEGTSVGTPAYMSPEQALGQSIDPRSDVYSLGILLYELVLRRLPFPVRTISEAVRYHTRESPPAPRTVNPDLPEALERVILKALEKEPGKRYPSAAGLGAVLEGSLDFSTEIAGPTSDTVTSLVTEYQKSVIAPPKPAAPGPMTVLDGGSLPPRGHSIFEGNSVPPGPGTRLQILQKDATAKVVTLPAGTVTLGRESDNSIVLNDTKASRHHMQIVWDGMQYHVMDLNSSNGTFIENTRLLPGVSEVWRPDQTLRIGNTWLRLILPETRAPSLSQPMSRTGNTSIYTTSSAGLVGVSVAPQQLTVEPGSSASAMISMLNQSPNVDHFLLTVNGIPSAWVADMPSSILLMPGEQKQESLVLQVPRSPQNRAGSYLVTLRLSSTTNPSQYVDHKLTVIVKPYPQFKTELYPQRLRVGQAGRLTIYNQGNVQSSYTGKFADFADELEFQPPQFSMPIPEGGSATQEFRAALRRPKWLGGETIHSYTAKISPREGEPQTLQAELISRAYIPTWVPPTLLPICLLFGAGLIWLLLQLVSPAADAPTPIPTLTAPVLSSGVPTLLVTDIPTAISTPTLPLTGVLTLTPTNSPTITPTATFTSTSTPSLTHTPTSTVFVPNTWALPYGISSQRTIYYLRLAGPGQIHVRLNWSGGPDSLAVILNGPGQVGYYARQDGPSGVELIYNVTAEDFAKGDSWRVTVASFSQTNTRADGTLEISYPNGSSQDTLTDPYFYLLSSVDSSAGARAVFLLVLNRPGLIQANTSWSGTPASLALIINGPGQVGYYARQDGGSPLSASYNVTDADVLAGKIWTVSVVSFSQVELNGSIQFNYP